MAVGQSYEGNRARDEAREKDAARRREEAANKIVQFFEESGVAASAKEDPQIRLEPGKIYLTVVPGGIMLDYWGYRISVATNEPNKHVASLGAWCKDNMSHAKIKSVKSK